MAQALLMAGTMSGMLRVRRSALILAFFAALAFVVAGCSGDTGSEDTSTTSQEALDANEQPAFTFFVGKGLTAFQAAGVVGNLVQESNVNPSAVQAGGPGRGIAQWSVGGRWDHSSGDNAVSYASSKGLSVYSLTLQLEFIWYELTTFSGYGLARLRATTNVTDATIAFQDDFEGCGTCDQSNRIAYAKAALAAFGDVPYAATYVDQSFPLATTTLKMKAGQVIPSSLTMKNTGTKAWDGNTKLGTTDKRDRSSAFADSTWQSPSRLDSVSDTVPVGGEYKFQFDLHAPNEPGLYDEHFGLVEEGVAWFGDPGQGGPSDTQIEVKIQVLAADDDGGLTEDGDGGLAALPGDPAAASPSASASSDMTSPDTGCSASPRSAGSDGSSFLIAIGIVASLRRRRRAHS